MTQSLQVGLEPDAPFQDSQKICDSHEEGKVCGNIISLLVFESHGEKK